MGSTQLQDPAVDELSAAHYPVDDITEKTNCELHAPMRNISYPMAKGYALPHQPGATFYFGEVPAGFARVGVTTVMAPFHSIDLDIPGAEGEKTLGEVELGIVLWKKQYINFPDSAPIPLIRNSPHKSLHASPAIGSPPRVHRPRRPVSRLMRPLVIWQSGSCSSRHPLSTSVQTYPRKSRSLRS